MMIEKYSVPTKFDIADYGTVWRNIGSDIIEYYIQISQDKDNPNWLPIKDFLHKIFEGFYNSDLFINQCLQLNEEVHFPMFILNLKKE